jgi:hypothetical protein
MEISYLLNSFSVERGTGIGLKNTYLFRYSPNEKEFEKNGIPTLL